MAQALGFSEQFTAFTSEKSATLATFILSKRLISTSDDKSLQSQIQKIEIIYSNVVLYPIVNTPDLSAYQTRRVNFVRLTQFFSNLPPPPIVWSVMDTS